MNAPTQIAKYHVIRELKRGGMGVLYLCHQPGVNREVAVKVLRPGLDPVQLRERFEREMAAVGGLRHRNIVTIFDGDLDNDPPYLAMEFIPGETLGDLIARRAPVPFARKLQIIDEICAGLAYAHDKGIIHRDVKPANVMIDNDGTVKVLDFGVARMEGSDLTINGAMLGTLSYMAPEQMQGGLVDCRTDVFAVGALMYELLTYSRAFTGTQASEVTAQVLHAEPTSVDSVVPGLPKELGTVVDRCLQKESARRFRNMQEVRGALAAIADAHDATHVISGPARVKAPAREQELPSHAASGGATATSVRLPAARHEAVEAITTGQFARAMTLCSEALAADPADASARELLQLAQAGEARRRRHQRVGMACLAGAAVLVLSLWWRGYSIPSAVQPASGISVRKTSTGSSGASSGAPVVKSGDGADRDTSGTSASRNGPLDDSRLKGDTSRPGIGTGADGRDSDAGATSATPSDPADSPGSGPPERAAADSGPVELTLPADGEGGSRRTPAVPGDSVIEARPDARSATDAASGASSGAGTSVEEVPPVAAVNETENIVRTLNQYATALTNRNIPAVQAVRQVNTQTLQTELKDFESKDIVIRDPRVSIHADGMKATVHGMTTYRELTVNGRSVKDRSISRTYLLEKTTGGWIITDVK